MCDIQVIYLLTYLTAVKSTRPSLGLVQLVGKLTHYKVIQTISLARFEQHANDIIIIIGYNGKTVGHHLPGRL